MRVKKKSTIYTYLAAYIEQGPKAVEEARKRYWQAYRLIHRRESRQVHKTLEIGFTPGEWKTICKAARHHKRGRSRLVKQCALAYLDQRFLVPNVIAVEDIQMMLTQLLSFLKEKFDEKLLPEVVGKVVMVYVATLGDRIIEALEHPKLSNSDS